jgi:hypothetical protein
MPLAEEENEGAAGADEFLLYKWQAGWGLPSIDPSSTQAEVREKERRESFFIDDGGIN